MLLVEEELKRMVPERDTVLSIGIFDGVHLGHQLLISKLRERASEGDFLVGVVTFRQHPHLVLTGQKVPFLTSLAERVRLLRSIGVELIATLSFTYDLAGLPARDYLLLLKKYLKVRHLVVGEDFTLGKDREGNTAVLRQLGSELGIGIDVIPPRLIDGEVVSSTLIRQCLQEGNVTRANKLLGRPFRLEGRVVSGLERGRTLGFPTANLSFDTDQVIPGDGVYATLAHTGKQGQPSVTNIGVRPTFGGSERLVEVFIMDFQGDLYGSSLRVDFLKKLRDEIRFKTAEDLKAQVAKDAEKARKVLGKVS